ncbi:MAG: hypothetical protein ACLFU6_03045 [Candidatus Hydrogenedentota bacterium]
MTSFTYDALGWQTGGCSEAESPTPGSGGCEATLVVGRFMIGGLG